MINPWRISRIRLVRSCNENKVYLYSLKRLGKQVYEIRSQGLMGESHDTLEAALAVFPIYIQHMSKHKIPWLDGGLTEA